jgi:ADP-ribosylglycohydrolase
MNKIATLVGCAIGDALGVPFEMKSANSPDLTGWDGLFKDGATFHRNSVAGMYSDDTLMSLALASSIIEKQGFDPDHVAAAYLAWYKTGNTRGIGSTTAGAMMHLKLGASWQEAGATHSHDGRPAGGNGTAMRASPIGLWYRKDPEKLLSSAMQDAAITHNSFEPKMGSIAVALSVGLLANGTHDNVSVLAEIKEIVAESEVQKKLELSHSLLKSSVPPALALAQIGTSGYVPETVGATFYCLAATDNFQDAVIMAVKGGGDTDTTAAITGALAGTFYGLDGIPSGYKDKVENFQLLQDLTDELVNNAV